VRIGWIVGGNAGRVKQEGARRKLFSIDDDNPLLCLSGRAEALGGAKNVLLGQTPYLATGHTITPIHIQYQLIIIVKYE
jgi:hypothetical protein